MDDIEGKLNLTRKDLIAVAIMSCCDLDEKGVGSMGTKKTIEMMNEIKSFKHDPLERY